jgi:aconitate hydratase
LWPSRTEVQGVVSSCVTPKLFTEFYSKTLSRNERWNALDAPKGNLFTWTEDSTYIHLPPFFAGMTKEVSSAVNPIKNAYCLLNLPDSITTDHISPAGDISKTSAAAKYLTGRGIEKKDFNSYGARRGHDHVMARGTFANVRLVNKLVEKPGANTLFVPTNEQMSIYDASARYQAEGHHLIVLAGKEYGSGSSRDWAAKGPFMLGIKVVIA